MRRRHDLGYERLAEGICEAVVEALHEIAADMTQPIERRFAAARLKDLNDPRHRLHDPFWSGVDAICQDETTPIRLRWPAIRYAVRKDPIRIDRWRPELDGDEFGHLEAAYVYLAAQLRNAAVGCFHRALAEETDLRVRVRIWKELVLLGEGAFAGCEAARTLSDVLSSDQVETVDSELLEDLLLLSRVALPVDEFIELAKTATGHPGLNAYEIRPAATTLVRMRRNIGRHINHRNT